MPAVKPKTIAEALLKVQAEAQAIQKDKINPRFGSGYISLDSLLPQVLPVLQSAGVSVSQIPDQSSTGARALRTRLTHESGEWMEGTFPLPEELTDPQKIGGALTYFKRYAILSMLGLSADVDDDANSLVSKAPQNDSKPFPALTGDRLSVNL